MQSSCWLFLESSICGCGESCHLVGLEDSILLNRRLTKFRLTSCLTLAVGCLQTWTDTLVWAWIAIPASCVSAPIIGQRIVHPMSVYVLNPRDQSINQSIKSSFVKGAGAHPQNAPCRRHSHALRKAPVRRGRLLSTVLHRWSPR